MVRTALILLLFATTGCVGTSRYTSQDLGLLPCEMGDSPIFFRAVEFDARGDDAVRSQVANLSYRIRGDRPPGGDPLLYPDSPATDLVFFVHGWNKNPSSAELDYQNFLCRLHARLRTIIPDQKRQGGLQVVGVFWPSTITNKDRDPVLLKPVSYYRMRDRADMVAIAGLARLLEDVMPTFSNRSGLPIRLHLIGHSFGGRMLVRALERLRERDRLVPLLMAAGTVNVVLLNAAIPPERFQWLQDAVVKARAQGEPGRFTEDTRSYLFNVHSFNDTANRVLFRLASTFNDDPATCAAGACGVRNYATLCVDESGTIRVSDSAQALTGRRLNAWNVDASRIVFDHTDIYKGRMASLVANLLYDQEGKKRFPEADGALPDPAGRCTFLDAR